MTAHVHSVKMYLWVFAALLVLTVLTTAVARVDIGVFNTPVAMLIAAAKALIVALFFMHLRWSGYRSRVLAVMGIFWLAILVTFVVADVATRKIPAQPEGWKDLSQRHAPSGAVGVSP